MKFDLSIRLSSLSLVVLGCASSPDPIVTNDSRLEAQGEFLALTQVSGAESQALSPVSLRHIVKIASPELDGDTLQATDIHLVDKTAYISYNVAGSTQKGEVDVIDFNSVTRPRLISSLELPHHDANAIYRHKKNVFVVGAVNSGGAMLLSIPYEGELKDSYSSYSLESYAGTDVAVKDQKIYVTSGDTGSLQIFNLISMAEVASLPIADARGISVSANDKKVRVVKGQDGEVLTADSSASLLSRLELGGNTIAESKSTIESGKTTSIVSLGDKGFKVICHDNNQTLLHVSPPVIAGVAYTDTVTNSVSSDDGMIFAANGEAGVYVYTVSSGSRIAGTQCYSLKTKLLGAINFGTHISANHVAYKKNHLYVAAGLGGVHVIEVSKSHHDSDFDDFDDNDDDDDRD